MSQGKIPHETSHSEITHKKLAHWPKSGDLKIDDATNLPCSTIVSYSKILKRVSKISYSEKIFNLLDAFKL